MDWCHVAFLVASTALLVIFSDRVAAPWAWTGCNVGLLAMLLIAHRVSIDWSRDRQATVKMVGVIVTIPIVFTQLGSLVPFVNPAPWEQRLFDIDLVICGGTSPLHWLDRWSNRALTEVLQWIYDFYYFIPIMLGVLVARNGRPHDLARMLFLMTLCIYLSYVGYYLVPATGPNIDKYGLYAFARPVEGLFLTHELRGTLAVIEKIKQDCFPSGHTAVSLLSLMLAWRYARRSTIFFFPFVVGLIFSTVYLRYHYVADVVSGVALAVGAYYIGTFLHQRFEQRAGWVGPS